jgi:hypothetical protein
MLELLAVARRHGGADNASAWIALLIFGVVMAVAVAAMLYGKRLRRKRTEALQRIAGELGLEFRPLGSDGLVAALSSFALFSKGRHKKVLNMLEGGSGHRRLAIFDYDYTTGHGKGTVRWHTTVLSVGLQDAAIPQFLVRKKIINDRIMSWFRPTDIEIQGYPAFSQRYVLRGDEKAAIGALFTEPVMDFFDRNRGLSAEGGEHTLLLYRLGKRVKPDAIGDFLARGLEFVSLLKTG